MPRLLTSPNNPLPLALGNMRGRGRMVRPQAGHIDRKVRDYQYVYR
jgi:hypothetical protein